MFGTTKHAFPRNFACVIDENALNQLSNLMKEVGETIAYEIEMSDNTTSKYSSHEKILLLPNEGKNQIKKLDFSAYQMKGQNGRHISIVFDKRSSSQVRYHVYAEDDKDALYLFKRIEDTLTLIKLPRWYSFIAYHDIYNSFSIIFIALIVVIYIYGFSSQKLIGPYARWEKREP